MCAVVWRPVVSHGGTRAAFVADAQEHLSQTLRSICRRHSGSWLQVFLLHDAPVNVEGDDGWEEVPWVPGQVWCRQQPAARQMSRAEGAEGACGASCQCLHVAW